MRAIIRFILTRLFDISDDNSLCICLISSFRITSTQIPVLITHNRANMTWCENLHRRLKYLDFIAVCMDVVYCFSILTYKEWVERRQTATRLFTKRWPGKGNKKYAIERKLLSSRKRVHCQKLFQIFCFILFWRPLVPLKPFNHKQGDPLQKIYNVDEAILMQIQLRKLLDVAQNQRKIYFLSVLTKVQRK